MEEKRISPIKAIRLKCLDCCCGSSNEVKLYTVERCPLHPFREGKNPYREKKELSPAQIEQRRQALVLAHSKRGISDEKSKNTASEGTCIPERNSEEIHGRTEDF